MLWLDDFLKMSRRDSINCNRKIIRDRLHEFRMRSLKASTYVDKSTCRVVSIYWRGRLWWSTSDFEKLTILLTTMYRKGLLCSDYSCSCGNVA